jgi:hypothetical protein
MKNWDNTSYLNMFQLNNCSVFEKYQTGYILDKKISRLWTKISHAKPKFWSKPILKLNISEHYLQSLFGYSLSNPFPSRTLFIFHFFK